MRDIQIYNIKNVRNKANDEILREYARKIYKSSRKLVKSTYDDEEWSGGDYFYDNNHLSDLENILFKTAKVLYHEITYKPHKKQLEQVMLDLKTGDLDYFKPLLVEDVINDVAYQYFKEDEDLLDSHEGDCKFHCEYIIKHFKKIVNVLCKVMKENDIDPIYR